MILNKTNSNDYKNEFQKKFKSYGEKAPIVLSFYTDDKEVVVTHENSGTVHHYSWDFSVPVKTFIKYIKEDLSYHHYPRLSIDSKVYRIDKCMLLKDELVLINEETKEQSLYKLNVSSVLFLKNYREKKWDSIEDAGKYFSENSTLIKVLDKSSNE